MKRPNFLVIVADDLGYSDLGCYGSEIKTPNIDRIAREGVQFTDFHTAAMCSPTRSMIMSGTDNHIAGAGCMSESRSSNYPSFDKKGYEGYLNFDVAALPELLADDGYLTLMSGKWHLGLKPETNPAARGFERSFALLPGCTNHFGYEPQFRDEKMQFFKNIPVLYTEDGRWREVEANRQDDYKSGFYSTEYYASNLIRYLQDREKEDKDRPFFAYLPFAAPHWPLQCDKADRESYQGVYDEGPDVLRQQRLANLRRLGIIKEDVKPHEVVGFGTKEWSDTPDVERKLSSRMMEVYAGMVQCIDRNVGRVLDYLAEIGELDDTFVLFMSDNGAEGAIEEAKPILGRASLSQVIDLYYNNALDNVGNHDSFVMYGPRWAQAATAPSRLYKRYSTEGGILVPCVVRYPPGVAERAAEGPLVRAFATAMDIMPTILELAGVRHPAAARIGREKAPYRDRQVYRMTGHSWVPYLSGNGTQGEQGIYGNDFWQGWELHRMGAMRKGKWKIVYMPSEHPTGKDRWELFDLEQDPGETTDLGEQHPHILSELQDLFDKYVEETGTVWGPSQPKEIQPQGWELPDSSVGGNPQKQRERWAQDPDLRGDRLIDALPV